MGSWHEKSCRIGLCCQFPCAHSLSCHKLTGSVVSYHTLPYQTSHTVPIPAHTCPQMLWQASTSSPRHLHSKATHCDAVSALNCTPPLIARASHHPTMHALASPWSWALPCHSYYHCHCKRGGSVSLGNKHKTIPTFKLSGRSPSIHACSLVRVPTDVST